MAKKRRSGKSKSEKETEPKEETSFLGELLSLICRAPFPFNAGGLILKRIPPPWDKRALAIVLIAIGILIVHPLFSPVRDLSLWLYYRVIPEPQVQVNFNNYTKKSVHIGKEFTFWISENKRDNRDNAINGVRAISKGAITILPDTNEVVHISLGRDREIHRLYKGGGYLRLRFVVDEKEKELEDNCSNVISKGLSLDIYDPKQWTSPPIVLWFSEMADDEANKDYHQDHVYKAIRIIENNLDVFEILASEPDKPDPNRKFLNIKIGCYIQTEHRENELRLEIEENGVRLENTTITEPYKSIDAFESEQYVKRINSRLRENILYRYPPRGIIYELHPKELSSEEDAPQREICLNIGRLSGVLKGDFFKVLPENQDKDIGLAEITHALEQESSAVLSKDRDNEEVKSRCRVEWKKAR